MRALTHRDAISLFFTSPRTRIQTRPEDRHETSPLTGRERVSIGVFAIVASTMIALFAQWGSDWPAQQFRSWIAAHHGLSLVATQWYDGLPLWGYSILDPVISGVIGAGATGVLAVAATTWCTGLLIPPGLSRARAWLFQGAVVLTLLECLLIGQVTFLLGAACATACICLVRSSAHPGWMIAVAASLCSLASPLAGAFLAIAAPALGLTFGWRRCRWLTPCLLGSAVAVLAGGASGPDPFTPAHLYEILTFCVLLVAVRPRVSGPWFLFAVSYATACIGSFLVPNPVGGNIERFALVLAGPLTVLLAPAATSVLRHLIAAGLVALAVTWPLTPVLSSLTAGSHDASRHSWYYTGLLRFLHTQDPLTGRLEIPFTSGHWESYYVATQFPIARGWERQTDLLGNSLLYRPLTSPTYRTWLNTNAVALIALPNETMDAGGIAEANLLQTPPPYLSKIWANPDWTVYKVAQSHPIVTGPARLTAMGTSNLRLRFLHAGTALIRLRSTPLWQVTSGPATITRTGSHWLHVTATTAGQVTLTTSITGALTNTP